MNTDKLTFRNFLIKAFQDEELLNKLNEALYRGNEEAIARKKVLPTALSSLQNTLSLSSFTPT